MDSDRIAAFKKQLEEERRSVERELKTVGVQNPKNAEDWEAKETDMDVMTPMADQNEAADKMEEYIENRAINDELEVRFNEINRALKKIEQGTYGVCEVGGEEIEEARLKANPAARTCEKHLKEESSLSA